MTVEVRDVAPGEYAALGELTVRAYAAVGAEAVEGGYADELRDVGGRVTAGARVLVAIDPDRRLLGGVTYVADPSSPLAEHDVPGAASIRMLAVAPDAQRRGVGEALTRACVDLARADGRAEIVLHSTEWMTAAHRLYRRLGFRRAPELDWYPYAALHLMGFRLPVGGVTG